MSDICKRYIECHFPGERFTSLTNEKFKIRKHTLLIINLAMIPSKFKVEYVIPKGIHLI
jgi:hypothetical protein